MEKKRNHTIPNCLIKQWQVTNLTRPGVHVHEFKKNKTYFSAGTGRSPFSFAIESYLYVPKINDKREPKLENWFSKIETSLGFFLRKIKQQKEGEILRNEADYSKVLHAIFSLKNRSKYDIQSQIDLLSSNPEMAREISSDISASPHILILENLANLTMENALEYKKANFLLAENRNRNLILGDKPFIVGPDESYNFMALSPSILLIIEKSNSDPRYTHIDITGDSFIHTYNKKVCEQSNDWIIAQEIHILNEYKQFYQPDKGEYSPVTKKPEFLEYSYKF